MMHKLYIAAYIIILLCSIKMYPQCSDAGICSIGKQTHATDEEKSGIIILGYSLGKSGNSADVTGEINSLTYKTFKIECNLEFFHNFSTSVSLPYTAITGPAGSNSGMGDLIVTISRDLRLENEQSLALFFGGKFATGKVNSDTPLPQKYQPGLGTNDLLLGIGYNYKSFSAGLAYQKPFGRSNNIITQLKRGDDVLLRAGYREAFSRIYLRGELLAVFRLSPANIFDSAGNSEFEVNGSNETQINFLAGAGYKISDNISVQIQAAVPFLKREYNYDGLKRSFSFNTEILYNLNL